MKHLIIACHGEAIDAESGRLTPSGRRVVEKQAGIFREYLVGGESRIITPGIPAASNSAKLLSKRSGVPFDTVPYLWWNDGDAAMRVRRSIAAVRQFNGEVHCLVVVVPLEFVAQFSPAFGEHQFGVRHGFDLMAEGLGQAWEIGHTGNVKELVPAQAV